MEKVNHQFEPIYDSHSRILILGTIPSPKSREIGFYYGHPQNRFWKVLASVFDEPVPFSHDDKKRFLLKHHIALWDVLFSCEIEGASDQSIHNAIPNNLSLILKNAPIEQIFTTGKKAYDLYYRYCYPNTQKEAHLLPSPSPANCAVKLSSLIESYQILKHY